MFVAEGDVSLVAILVDSAKGGEIRHGRPATTSDRLDDSDAAFKASKAHRAALVAALASDALAAPFASAAFAASYAGGDFWETVDPIGVLERMIDV